MSLLQLLSEAAKESQELHSNLQDKHTLNNFSLKLLSLLREAIRHEFKIYPYDTQMFTLLGLLEQQPESKGRLAEVLTGEGKSTIITLLSSYLALSGQNVDIITSSSSLAFRDQKNMLIFFRCLAFTLRILVFQILSPIILKRKSFMAHEYGFRVCNPQR